MELLTKYIIALTNLYGIAPKKVVLEVYNSQNQKQLTIEELDQQTEASAEDLTERFVISMEEYFVDDSLLMYETDIPNLLAEKVDKPYYIPEKQELLRYEDDFYFEKTPPYKAFFNYMRDCFPGDKEYIEEVCEDIYDTIHLDGNTSSVFSDLELAGISPRAEEQVLHIHKLVLEMFYQMRLWQNNGHTFVEIAEMKGVPVGKLYSEGIGIQFFEEEDET